MNLERLRIIVLNFNRAEMTADCISNVMQQTYNPKDIIVVDNNSRADEFEKLCQLLPKEVTIIRCSSNLGYAGGNNVGAKLDNGIPHSTYTMILNNDVTLLDSDCCKKLIRALKHDVSRVACSPLVDTVHTDLPPEKQIQVRRIPKFKDTLISGSWWLRRLPWLSSISKWYTYHDARPYPINQEIDCESINGSCFIIRTDFLREIGYFDQGTFLYYEEIILGKQIKDQGKKACFVTSTVVRHDQGTTSGQRRGRVRINTSKEMLRSEVYYCRKYLKASPISIDILICIRIIDFVSKLAFQLFQGFFR